MAGIKSKVLMRMIDNKELRITQPFTLPKNGIIRDHPPYIDIFLLCVPIHILRDFYISL